MMAISLILRHNINFGMINSFSFINSIVKQHLKGFSPRVSTTCSSIVS